MGIFENSFFAIYCCPHKKFASAHPGTTWSTTTNPLIKTHTIFHLLGHWGECDPKTCPTNTSFTQDDNQIALEAKELIDQYKASDATNKKLDASLVNPTLTTNDCPCVKATQCKRIFTLLTKAKDISRAHPERKEIINYIRSQICDAKNQAVRCCGWW